VTPDRTQDDRIEFPSGMVWLVGAGPGDPDLLTRKAERLIRSATVVFHDALVGPGVLDLIPATTRRIHVGKRSGRHSQDQATIDRMIVAAALAGDRVVRLKGGDPSIFGRATEELTACREAGVPVAICPGITAASAAAASLGRSLTLRGLSRKLVFVTAHTRGDEPLDLDWSSLADPAATLAIYMGKSAAPAISRNLIAAGLNPGCPRPGRQPRRGAPARHAAGPAHPRRERPARLRAAAHPGRQGNGRGPRRQSSLPPA
jgi:uroporphyrin-III C-methyltransferase